MPAALEKATMADEKKLHQHEDAAPEDEILWQLTEVDRLSWNQLALEFEQRTGQPFEGPGHESLRRLVRERALGTDGFSQYPPTTEKLRKGLYFAGLIRELAVLELPAEDDDVAELLDSLNQDIEDANQYVKDLESVPRLSLKDFLIKIFAGNNFQSDLCSLIGCASAFGAVDAIRKFGLEDLSIYHKIAVGLGLFGFSINSVLLLLTAEQRRMRVPYVAVIGMVVAITGSFFVDNLSGMLILGVYTMLCAVTFGVAAGMCAESRNLPHGNLALAEKVGV